MLTGDISTGTLDAIARQDCVQLNKPVKLSVLSRVIQVLLRRSQFAAHAHVQPSVATAVAERPPVIFVVDDDSNLREMMRAVLEDDGRNVEDYATCEAFFEAYRPGQEACLVIDAHLPGMNGRELLRRMGDAGHRLPAIMITGNSDVSIAVQAMKAGALDFIEKLVGRDELLAVVRPS
jgi:two-component system CheB/CheR fusion protein